MKFCTDNLIAGEFFKNQTFKDKKKGKITFSLNSPLSLYDKIIYFSIITEYIKGKKSISYNAINQNIGSNNLTKQRKAEIKSSLNRLTKAFIIIDCSKEAKKHKTLLNEYKGYLLQTNITKNNIIIQKEPILLLYLKAKNALSDVKLSNYFLLKNTVKRNLEIQQYLTDQLFIRQRIINNNKPVNTKINLQNLYSLLSITSGTERNRAKLQINTLLSKWKQNGIIADYKICKRGNKYTHIDLKLHREKC